MIKLYGISRSRAARSLWALEEIGIEYESVPIHFMGDTKKPDFLALNPNGRVPVLTDGEVTLFESMAINLYLAKKYDGGLQPKTLEDEARAVQWSFWGMSELEASLIQMLLHRVMLPEAERDASQIEAAAQALERPLRVLDGQLADRPHLLGDAFSIADLNVASVLSLAKIVSFELDAFPHVKRWFDACLSRPAFTRALQS